MIYTVTLNPALDRTVVVDSLTPDDTVRLVSDIRHAAGKGVDVSRVIRTLGGNSVALGFYGGFEGMELEGRLMNDGIISNLTPVGGSTRVNLHIHVRETNEHYLIAAKGPDIQPVELGNFMQRYRSMVDPSYVVISGSLPPGVNSGIYGQLVLTAREKGALVALDADGASLKAGLSSGPDIIKPNAHELGRLVGKPLSEEKDIVAAARSLHASGVGYVLVSLGSRGIILVSDEGILKGVPPKVETDSTVGAGDSALAGFIYAHSLGRGLEGCLQLACAAGAATAMSQGTSLCAKEIVEELSPLVQVTEVAG